ncbi:MAG: efflux RND transporter periplasmic adaptor subunit [Victivallales bacterium]|nr:efflux RND transporter periplasmic adaptor subunit [Victivallales bacterium]
MTAQDPPAIGKKSIFRRLRIIPVILVLIVFAVILYLNYTPPGGVVLVEEAAVPLRAPVAAELKTIIGPKQKTVHKGDLLATLFISSALNAESSKDLLDRSMDADRIKFDMVLDAMRFEIESQRLEQEEIKLRLEENLTKGQVEREKIALEKARQLLQYQQEQKDKVERLWNMKAVSHVKWTSAQREYSIAVAELKMAKLRYDEAISRSEFASRSLTRFLSGVSRQRQRINAAIAALQKYLKSTSAAIGNIRELDSGYTIDLLSPIDGIVVDRAGPVGTFIAKGEPVITLYDPNNIKIYAYVKGIWRSRLKPGQEVRVRMEDKDIHSTISYIYPNLVAPPTVLQNRKMLSMENYYLKVELNHHNFPNNIVPGKIGHAVFGSE